LDIKADMTDGPTAGTICFIQESKGAMSPKKIKHFKRLIVYIGSRQVG